MELLWTVRGAGPGLLGRTARLARPPDRQVEAYLRAGPPRRLVRPGLVGIGVVLAVLGAGTLVAVYAFPSPAPPQTQVTNVGPVAVGGGTELGFALTGWNFSAGSYRVSWQVTGGPAAAQLSRAAHCGVGGWCPSGEPLRSWPANASGSWSSDGPLGFPLYFLVINAGRSAVILNLGAAETIPSDQKSTLPALTAIFVDAGSIALLAIGGIAVFLGLFLGRVRYTGDRVGPGASADRSPGIAPGGDDLPGPGRP
jgi:hypothetical protein